MRRVPEPNFHDPRRGQRVALSRGSESSRTANPVTEESTFGASVGVIVVRDVSHVVVYVDIAELGGGNLAQPLVHVSEVLARRLGTMKPPNDHRDLAHVTLGDPADLVLVIPGGDARRSAEIAALDLGEETIGVGHKVRG